MFLNFAFVGLSGLAGFFVNSTGKSNPVGLRGFSVRKYAAKVSSAAIIFGLTPFAIAQTGDVSVRLDVFKVTVDAGGKEISRPADTVLPDDVLEYRAVYLNRGKNVARNVEATLPIPTGNVIYIAESARPRSAMASTDGLHFDDLPLKRAVTKSNGPRQIEAVPLVEYRSLRWKLGDLPAGGQMAVTARVRVSSLGIAEPTKESLNGARSGADNNAVQR